MATRQKNKARVSRAHRPRLAFVLLGTGFAVVAANQARVQVFGRDEILGAAAAVDRLFARQVLPARRGDIYSSNGRVLARSPRDYRLGFDSKRLPMSPALWAEVATVTGVSAGEAMDLAARGRTAGLWDAALSPYQASRLAEIKAKYGADGLWLEPSGERHYSLGALAAPVIGYVEGGKGKAGVERSFDEYLAGKDGVLIGMTDRKGNFLPWLVRKSDSHLVANGEDVTLTINSNLQVAAMKSLAAHCEANKAEHGAAIVIDPKTGDILALASWPTYVPSDHVRAQAETAAGKRTSPEMNAAVGMTFEPGSTFKVFTVALGVESGAISPGETVHCSGSKPFSAATIHCAGDHALRAHGTVTKELCIEASCNVTAATWGTEIGFERYSQTIERLGLLERTHIGVLPEARGMLNYRDYNRIIQMANIGFGQSINVTPIAFAAAYTVFANGGRRAQPRLIKRLGGIEQPVRISQLVFKAETARLMLSLMEAVVQGDRGTGKRLRIPGYTLAGKTGTAQKLNSQTGRSKAGRDQEARYVSSFVGYVIANEPRAVVLVMIDSPKAGRYYGAVVAGPVFKDIAKSLIQEFKIPPNSAGAALAVR